MISTFAAIVAGITAALNAAPAVTQLVQQTKDYITALFTAGVITAEQQNTLHAHCDAHMQATLRGEKPPELVIDPD